MACAMRKCCHSRCESPGDAASDEVACLTSDVANAPQKSAAILAETLVPSLISLLMASKRISKCSVAAQLVFLAGVIQTLSRRLLPRLSRCLWNRFRIDRV